MVTDTLNAVSRYFYRQQIGLLVLRVATGLIFLTHGYVKVMSLSDTAAMFAHMGLGGPTGYFIAWLELIGGLALVLGVATRFFGFVFGIEMLVATLLMGFGRGLGFEFYLSAVSFAIALLGSGALSALKMECENCGGLLCDGETCVVEEVE